MITSKYFRVDTLMENEKIPAKIRYTFLYNSVVLFGKATALIASKFEVEILWLFRKDTGKAVGKNKPEY